MGDLNPLWFSRRTGREDDISAHLLRDFRQPLKGLPGKFGRFAIQAQYSPFELRHILQMPRQGQQDWKRSLLDDLLEAFGWELGIEWYVRGTCLHDRQHGHYHL